MGKKGEGYAPLDLESSINTGQWRTIEEHERLQQGGVSSSSTSALEQPSNSQVDDFYAKQRQGQGQGQTQHYTRKKLCAWIAGGRLHYCSSGLDRDFGCPLLPTPSCLDSSVACVPLLTVFRVYNCMMHALQPSPSQCAK